MSNNNEGKYYKGVYIPKFYDCSSNNTNDTTNISSLKNEIILVKEQNNNYKIKIGTGSNDSIDDLPTIQVEVLNNKEGFSTQENGQLKIHNEDDKIKPISSNIVFAIINNVINDYLTIGQETNFPIKLHSYTTEPNNEPNNMIPISCLDSEPYPQGEKYKLQFKIKKTNSNNDPIFKEGLYKIKLGYYQDNLTDKTEIIPLANLSVVESEEGAIEWFIVDINKLISTIKRGESNPSKIYLTLMDEDNTNGNEPLYYISEIKNQYAYINNTFDFLNKKIKELETTSRTAFSLCGDTQI